MLNYDFDVVAPDGRLNDAGELPGPVARFRDAKTIEALKDADKLVRAFFLKSGFDLRLSRGTMPAGTFAAEDMEAREQFVTNLADNLPMLDVGVTHWGGIDMRAFTNSYLEAKPVETAEVIPDHPDRKEPMRHRGLRLLGIGAGAGVLAFAAVAAFAS